MFKLPMSVNFMGVYTFASYFLYSLLLTFASYFLCSLCNSFCRMPSENVMKMHVKEQDSHLRQIHVVSVHPSKFVSLQALVLIFAYSLYT